MNELFQDDIFHELEDFLPSCKIVLKLESYNVGGSIKMKTALALIDDLERRGRLLANSTLVESSSGNLGIAMAILCARKGLHFVCVMDPNSSPCSRQIIRSYGASLVLCDRRDSNGGFLQQRIDLVKEMCVSDARLVWPNQYANSANSFAHYKWTAPAIIRCHPDVDAIFVGVGTTGTLMGCAKYTREAAPTVRIVPVDSVGSVVFSRPAGIRHIPGMGSSRIPELFDSQLGGTAMFVPEIEGIYMCRFIAKRYGLLIGGSTGSVLAGVVQAYRRGSCPRKVVVISPDSGERYLDTIFNDSWVKERFPEFEPQSHFTSNNFSPASTHSGTV
jgi:2,3-diaminopropionate biosynthesis protein SbnA